jgi:nucleoside-diphosphate-sugar epimerase
VSERVVTITGGSGFVGQLIRPGLAARGYEVRVFDRLRGPLVDQLRRRQLGTASWPGALQAATRLKDTKGRIERGLIKTKLLRPRWDDILDIRSRLAQRFEGSHAVIHLAGIPHPNAPGTLPDDFRRINYDGSVNVFEAAVWAGVPKFVFASSAQVYRINDPVRLDQFPLLESSHCPSLEEGQSMYGYLKREFERYMEKRCGDAAIQGVALRLEYPGFRSTTPANLYVSTSIENLVAGFAAALEAPASFACEAFNLADAEVDPRVVDVQAHVRERWPEVPNHTTGNQTLVSIDKAREVLGYSPRPGGAYIHPELAW